MIAMYYVVPISLKFDIHTAHLPIFTSKTNSLFGVFIFFLFEESYIPRNTIKHKHEVPPGEGGFHGERDRKKQIVLCKAEHFCVLLSLCCP